MALASYVVVHRRRRICVRAALGRRMGNDSAQETIGAAQFCAGERLVTRGMLITPGWLASWYSVLNDAGDNEADETAKDERRYDIRGHVYFPTTTSNNAIGR